MIEMMTGVYEQATFYRWCVWNRTIYFFQGAGLVVEQEWQQTKSNFIPPHVLQKTVNKFLLPRNILSIFCFLVLSIKATSFENSPTLSALINMRHGSWSGSEIYFGTSSWSGRSCRSSSVGPPVNCVETFGYRLDSRAAAVSRWWRHEDNT